MMTEEIKHYIVVLHQGSRPDDYKTPGKAPNAELDHAKEVRDDIRRTARNFGFESELKDINIIPGAPIIYVECSARLAEELQKIAGIREITRNTSFDRTPENAPRASANRNNRPRGNIFKR
jgi:hypothetical protein